MYGRPTSYLLPAISFEGIRASFVSPSPFALCLSPSCLLPTPSFLHPHYPSSLPLSSCLIPCLHALQPPHRIPSRLPSTFSLLNPPAVIPPFDLPNHNAYYLLSPPSSLYHPPSLPLPLPPPSCLIPRPASLLDSQSFCRPSSTLLPLTLP